MFRVPVSIKLVTPEEDGHPEGLDQRSARRRSSSRLETKPLLVRFDEDNVLIKEITFPKERDELLYQLKNDDVIGRMDAAAALLAFKDDPRTAGGAGRERPDRSVLGGPQELSRGLGPAGSQKRRGRLEEGLPGPGLLRSGPRPLVALGDLKDRAPLRFL